MEAPTQNAPVYVYTSPLIHGISHDLIYPVVVNCTNAEHILQTQGPRGIIRQHDVEYDPQEHIVSITLIPHTELYVVHTIDCDNINNIYIVSKTEVGQHSPTMQPS